MAIRFPKANTWFQAQTDTNLAVYAQAIHDGLLAAIVTFPTPPILPAALQLLINAYNAALALATGPGAGKINTANKNVAKLNLKLALRRDCQYVNDVITGLIATGTSYNDAQTLILSTGYQLSADPVPVGPLPPVVVLKYGSYTKEQFYILVEKIRGAKGYTVRCADITSGTDIFDVSFPSSRMTILNGLISGHEYTFSIAAIGANPNRDFSTQITGQFIL